MTDTNPRLEAALGEVRAERAAYPKPTTEPPDMEEALRAGVMDGEGETSDGCMVEPDGFCEHGHPSWLRRWGLI